MYSAFFALEELPFSIAPNPRYLFMSDRHREALNHLTHGLGDTGGFVLLTGEVGTGKTTISRCLMEQLPDNMQSAFILNPMLSSQELLATICDELKIRYRKTGATLKTLTDKIQEKLLKNHANNINTLLIIDEAQHLQPEVLEQLRLLTNLETNTKKLLQVILIGQPELQQLLRRRDLRQLAQRITARYHLLPLNKQEVVQYIKHRLSVAQCHRPIFNASAVALIHKCSQGIPRLINLICDRSLMNAYNNNDAVVNKKIVRSAAEEVLGDDNRVIPWWHQASFTFTLSGFVIMLLVSYWFGQRGFLFDIAKQQPTATPQVKTTEPSIVAEAVSLSESISLVANAEVAAPNTIAVAENKDKAVKLAVNHNENIDAINKATEAIISSSPSNEVTQQRLSQEKPHSVKSVNTTQIAEYQDAEVNYKVNSIEGISDDLLSRFQSAIDDTGPEKIPSRNDLEPQNTAPLDTSRLVPLLTDMPLWVQNGVPSLNFNMHIYASDGEGWVRVNGRDRYQGDKISEDLFISEIQPQKVVLTYRGEKFSLPALSSW